MCLLLPFRITLTDTLKRCPKQLSNVSKKAIENTGYIPSAQAQAMVKKSSGIIAVLILDNTNAWAAQMTNGIEDAALEAGYQTIICNSRFDPTLEADWVEKMLSIGADGMLIQPTNQFRAVDRRIC